jgi:hypothetical protein
MQDTDTLKHSVVALFPEMYGERVQDANTATAGAQGFQGGSDAHAAANALQAGLGPTRLVSGMSIENFVQDNQLGVSGADLTPMVVSRNASGLDTMQSIEHALPDGDGQQCS